VHRDTLARQRQRGDASDRPTAGDQYGTFRCRHLRSSALQLQSRRSERVRLIAEKLFA
jgi:hypothetical protein